MTTAELEKIVDKALMGYRMHREFDDLRQEGLVGAWLALQTETDQVSPSRLAWDGARWAVAAYFRSRRCHPNDYRRGGSPNPVQWVEYSEELVHGREPDFAPRLIAQLWGRQIAAELKATCTPRQWEVVELAILEGLQNAGTAQRLGIAACSVKTTVARTLRNYRRSFPGEENRRADP